MKCKCWQGTTFGHSLGKKSCLVLGNALQSDQNFCILLAGVPVAIKSSLVRFSFNFFLPCCVVSISCIWNPSHIRPIISMFRVAIRFSLPCDGVGVVLLGTTGMDVAV